MPEALAAFDEAVRLAPDSPYVLLEHAQILARVADASRAPGARGEYLKRAGQSVARARELAPESLDVLRAVGSIYLDLAAQDPAALATAQEALEAVRKQDPEDPQSMFTLSQIYIDQKQPEKAAEVLRELITLLPQQRIAYTLLVEALLRASKEAEAEQVLGELLSFDPGSLEARLTLGELQSQRGDHRAAAATLQTAPEDVRDDPRLRRQLAWELYRIGDLAAALENVEVLLGARGDGTRLPPGSDHSFLSMLKGLIFAAEGRHDEALGLLLPLSDAQPDNLALSTTVARALRRGGRTDEAVRRLTALAERLGKAGKTAEEEEIRLEIAQILYEEKRWNEVGRAAAALLASKTEGVRIQAAVLQADALVQDKRYDDAVELLGRDPERARSPLVRSRRAEALFRAGREREARQLLTEMAAGDPPSVLAAAQSWQRLERYEESIPILGGLVERQPDLVAAGFLLGVAYERTGQRDKAVAEFRRVLKSDPEFHAALNYLGYTYAEAGENLDEALTLVRRAVALEPDNGSYVDSLGWTYYQLGRHEQARGYLERAARLDPTDATLQEHLGDVYVALGQTEQARAAYRRALELGDDNLDQVRRKLEKLQEPSSVPQR